MANVQDLDLDCFGNLKLSNLCDYKPSFSAGRMFMKKMVILMCCLMWTNFFGLPAAAQYVRPGWFVVDKVEGADGNFEEEKHGADKVEEPEADIVLGAEESYVSLSGKEHMKHPADEKPAGTGHFRENFSLNNQNLRLAAVWLKQEMLKAEGENFVLSPLSFYILSVLIANGVVDESLLEFSKMFPVLRIRDVDAKLAEYLKSQNEGIMLVNSLWGKVFSKRYREQMNNMLGTEIWSLQEDTAPINAWLKEKTGGAFNNAVENRPVPEGALFLAGAAYFDGEWKFPFEEENTKLLNFYNMDGSIGKVMMMSQELVTDYYEDAVMQAVRLYFASGDYLTVFLPRAASDFNKFTANIGEHRLGPEFNRERVEVSLPQFELFYKISDFRSLYALFGVQKIFLPDNYDFAKMINYDFPAYVEEVALQTKIRVRETRVRSGGAGGNGAAETVKPSAVTGLLGKDVKEFRANRPFIFMVNEGDIIGVYVKGRAEAAETAGKEDFQKTGTVYVREKKNGTPAWYEDKNQRGDFILRNDLKDKTLSDGNVSEAVLF